MEKVWSDLSPDEKRRERYNKVLHPANIEFITSEVKEKYTARAKRLVDAYQMHEPDRVPVRISGGYFPAHFSGISGRDLIYDAEKQARALIKMLESFDADMVAAGAHLPGKALETLDFKMYKWPGWGLAEQVLSHQYEENEYMQADEYDALIDDPTDFWLRTYLPRIFGVLTPLKKLPRFTGIYEIPTAHFAPFGRPDVQAALQALMDAGNHMTRQRTVMGKIRQKTIELGFPSFVGGFAKAPFDIIGDTLRGTRGIMLDMFRQPDKLVAAMERLVPLEVKSAVKAANASGKPGISMPLHKGADGFMSDEQFRAFYWPTLKEVLLGMIQEGVVPMLFAEGGYDSRLEVIRELPKASTVWLFDRTDMTKAKELMGGTACIEGNVPASMLTHSTPAEVKAYCRDLIETCGPGGGYVLASGASAEKANPDNFHAMIAAAKDFGPYC